MKGHRRILFVNKPFQIRFCIYVCSWILVLTLVYPVIIRSLFEFMIGTIRARATPEILASLIQSGSDIMLLVILFHVLFMIVVFLMSIFVSHRIAGPIYKITQVFRNNRGGNLAGRVSFRKADYFLELADEYNDMMSDLQSFQDDRNAQIEELASRLETKSKGSPDELRREVLSAIETLRKLGKRAEISTEVPEA